MFNTKASVSIKLLEKLVLNYFSEKNQACTIYCDNCDVVFKRTEIVNIVLFGAGMKDIFFCDKWPRNNKYRIWLLNSNHKRRFIKYFGFEEDDVSVINRYDLFPISTRLVPPLKLSGDLCFVYSGRASTLKNFKLAASFLNHLAVTLKVNVRLQVCAPLFKLDDFKKSLASEISLEVEFLGDLGVDWVSHIEEIDKKILINLSLDPIDDFNVSLAQWQQRGGAALLSTIGPYREVIGRNVYKMSSETLLKALDLNNSKDALDEMLNCFTSHFKIESKLEPSSILSLSRPLDSSYIQRKIAEVTSELKTSIFSLNTYDLNQLSREILLDEK